MAESELKFTDKVLDNVHGFIYYTEAESKIMKTLLFKRLQSIKQLSIVNWVFPGSEHTRYIHSLGVMYIADKIAVQLNLTIKERKIVRLAGLLHDIGHYPLSHVSEFPYKKNLKNFSDNSFCKEHNREVKLSVDGLINNENIKFEFMKQSNGYHHEVIGTLIISNDSEIKNIIINECGIEAIDIICDMITGNVERETTDPLLVQILHSELDADGIDYLMRDAMFSGTSFGAFELQQLISCMEIGIYNEKRILCINPKGIAAADQYLLNKFFSYSQVVFNKHISVTEFMAEQIVNWMQKNNAYFPRNSVMVSWIKQNDFSTKNSHYIAFNDNFFWASLQNILENPLNETVPNFIKNFCTLLTQHNELIYEDNSEVKIISSNNVELKAEIENSIVYKNLDTYEDKIVLLNEKSITKQVPGEIYEQFINNKDKVKEDIGEHDNNSDDYIELLRMRRFMECICVKEDSDIHLLCDDKRSLLRTLWSNKLVILRAFNYINS